MRLGRLVTCVAASALCGSTGGLAVPVLEAAIGGTGTFRSGCNIC